MGMTKENSITANVGGTSEVVVVGAAASAPTLQSATTDGEYWIVTVKAECFMRKGLAPVAAPNVDQILLANQSFRVGPLNKNDKLAFYSVAGGNVYVTPQG